MNSGNRTTPTHLLTAQNFHYSVIRSQCLQHCTNLRSTHIINISRLTSSFPEGHPDLDDLLRRAADRRTHAFRPGTQANHERYMRSYVAFCLQYRIDDLAPTAQQLSAYVEFLLHSGISPSTIPNFLAGVKHYLQAAGMDSTVLTSYTLSLTLRSLRIDYSQTPNRKHPITLKQVRKLVDYCGLKGLLGFTLRLAILLGFFGLLRISNLAPLTTSSFDPLRHSTRADLIVEAPGLQFTQKWAKNRQTSLPAGQVPQIPLVNLPGDPLDPVQALLDLHNLTPTAGPTDPMLLIPTLDGRFYIMDQRRLRAEFRQALIACDLDPRQYTPHSLRRGGATLLHHQGASRKDIKRQGLWRSEAVEDYIDDTTLRHNSVIRAFADSVRRQAERTQPQQQPRPARQHQHRRQRHRQSQKYKKGPNHKNRFMRQTPPRK